MPDQAKTRVQFSHLPEGTVTFLFTDIEGSTQLLSQLRDRYADLLADQRRILREAFANWNGQEVDTQGDAFFVAFPRATQAVCAAVEIQRALSAHDWSSGAEVRVRMGLHTGEPLKAEEGYVGMDVHRAARIAHVGHGGQVLLSETTAALVRDELPTGVSLLDLGRQRLKDLSQPEHIRQLVIEGLSGEFPPLKSLEMLPPAIALDIREVKLPDFLKEETELAPPPVFVGRERELARLQGFLDRARTGQGGLVFITGGPGRGKTALMQAFARRSMEAHPGLLVASGKCNAYTGVGDPYLPFREVLDDLSGDVGAKWAAGLISTVHAKRLWQVMPITAQALVDHGPDLMEVFIPGKGLPSRISVAVPDQRSLLQSLRALAERERALPGELEQKALFEQYLDVLCELATRQPLLVLLDDLQWADTASLNLLFHLGRELSGGRILLVGAYRPEEVALGRGRERHPLEKILAELKRIYGNAWIDLSQIPEGEGQRFVDDFIDSEPNRLGGTFREALLAQTGGHPLFTIELLREMQARGDLVQDEDGYWVEGETLNWDLLPARVEGVIEARIGRLEDELREILTIASVEGEDFTAQVIARVQEIQERGLLHLLNHELDRKHRLVQERGQQNVEKQRLYLYRFRHSLFQQHLYNGLAASEREILHAEVGKVLEDLFGEGSEEVAAQLAWHFSEAGEVDKAIHYLLLSGDRARQVYAYQEAIDFYQRAVRYLKEHGDDELAARTLMKLGLTYHTIFDYRRSRLAYDEAFALRQRVGTRPPFDVEPAPHPFRIHYPEPPRLDPIKSGDDFSEFYIRNIFSGLVELGADYEIIPDVAHSWEISDDGCRYRFHLHDNVTWSDGNQATAMDFECACKRTLDPANEDSQLLASLLYDIKGARAYHRGEIFDPDRIGVRAVDPITLEVELERPASYFLHLLSTLFPVPRHVVEAYGEAWTKPENLVSNGPFLLASYQPGESITLTRNPSYHGRFPGNLEVVDLKFKGTGSLEMYEADEIDFTPLDPDTYSARYRHAEEYTSSPVLITFFVHFDSTRTPLDDLRVRRAFVMAVDRERLVGEILAGLSDPASGGFVPPGMPGHSPGIALPYDPQQARQLLAQAGYPDGQGFPKLHLKISPWRKNTADYLIAQWRQNLNVEVGEGKEYFEKKHSNDLIFGGWVADYPDPDNFLRVCVQRNMPHWRNETYERLLEDASRSRDQNTRIRLYQAADKILIEEAVIMPTYYMRRHALVKPWVKFPGLEHIYLLLKKVIIEPH